MISRLLITLILSVSFAQAGEVHSDLEVSVRNIQTDNQDNLYIQDTTNKITVRLNTEIEFNDNVSAYVSLSDYNDDTSVEIAKLIMSRGFESGSIQLSLGTQSLTRGFFNPGEASNKTGVIIPNYGVYNPGFSEGLASQYTGANVTGIAYTPFGNVYGLVGTGQGRLTNVEKAEEAFYDGKSKYTSVRQGRFTEMEVGTNISNIKLFYIASITEHYIDETDYSKSLTQVEKYLAFISEGLGATFVGAVDDPYVLRIQRVGTVIETPLYSFQAEAFDMENTNESDLPFDIYGSTGWFGLARLYATDSVDLYASYGASGSKKEGTKKSTHQYFGISYSNSSKYSFNAEYHQINTNSWTTSGSRDFIQYDTLVFEVVSTFNLINIK